MTNFVQLSLVYTCIVMFAIGFDMPEDFKEIYKKQKDLKCSNDNCGVGTTMSSQYYFADFAVANNLTGTFVELGVNYGGYAHHNLYRWIGDTYVMIDPKKSKKRLEIIKKYEDLNRKIIHYQKSDRDVVDKFPDGSVDVLYVDASHSYAQVKQYLKRWWDKIKPGGLLCGDDYAASKEHLQEFFIESYITGPWIGTCTFDPLWNENHKNQIIKLCNSWGLLGNENRDAGKGGTVKAIGEFSRIIHQPIGVTLDGRHPSNVFPFVNGNFNTTTANSLFPICKFEVCYLDKDTSVRNGERYFNPPGWYFVKPL